MITCPLIMYYNPLDKKLVDAILSFRSFFRNQFKSVLLDIGMQSPTLGREEGPGHRKTDPELFFVLRSFLAFSSLGPFGALGEAGPPAGGLL